MRNGDADAIEVFISYAHEDAPQRDRFEKHLSSLRRQGVIRTWVDRDIRPGVDWSREINDHINSAHVVLALLTADFQDSEYINGVEMDIAFKRTRADEARLIPVYVKPVLLDPMWKSMQVILMDKPVISWRPHDAAWKSVATTVEGEIQALLAERRRFVHRYWDEDLPARTLGFTAREDELTGLRARFVADPRSPIQIVTGSGGTGKSALAIEYAWRHRSDYDIVGWIPSENRETIEEALAVMARGLDLPAPTRKREVDRVLDFFGEHGGAEPDRWLLIFDNVAAAASIEPYLRRQLYGDVLITSRDPSWVGVGKVEVLRGLGVEQAAAYLIDRTGDRDQMAATAIAELYDGRPKTLEHAAAEVTQHGQTLAQYLRVIRTSLGGSAV